MPLLQNHHHHHHNHRRRRHHHHHHHHRRRRHHHHHHPSVVVVVIIIITITTTIIITIISALSSSWISKSRSSSSYSSSFSPSCNFNAILVVVLLSSSVEHLSLPTIHLLRFILTSSPTLGANGVSKDHWVRSMFIWQVGLSECKSDSLFVAGQVGAKREGKGGGRGILWFCVSCTEYERTGRSLKCT